MKKLLLFCLLGFNALLPVAGYALSLGELRVYSSVNEPLRAEIEILSLNPESDIKDLRTRLAPPELFGRFGLRRESGLEQLRFINVKKNGKPKVVVSSHNPFAVARAELLLQIEDQQGEKIFKKFSLNLPRPKTVNNPPVAAVLPESQSAFTDALINTTKQSTQSSRQLELAKQANKLFATSSKQLPLVEFNSTGKARLEPSGSGMLASSQRANVKPAPPGQARSKQKRNYTVKRGDTLYKIAAATRYSSVGTKQMLLALFRKNTRFFSKRSINQLEIGDRLKLPSRKEAAAVSRSEARRFTNRLKQNIQSAKSGARNKTSDTRAKQIQVTRKPELIPVAEKTQKPSSASKVQQGAPGASGSSGQAVNAQAERLVKLEQQFSELQQQVKKKEGLNKQLSQLLKQKNRLLLRQSRADELASRPLNTEINKPSTPSNKANLAYAPLPKQAVRPALPQSSQPRAEVTLRAEQNSESIRMQEMADKVYQGAVMLISWFGNSILQYPMSVAIFIWLLILTLMSLRGRVMARYNREVPLKMAETKILSEQKPEADSPQITQAGTQPMIPVETETSTSQHDLKLDKQEPCQCVELQSTITPLRGNIYALERLSTELKVIQAPRKLQLIN